MKHTRIVFAALAIATAALGQSFTAPDFDRDGVPDARDGCPNTPPGSILLAPGCSALDLVENPGGITKPIAREMKKIAGILEARRDVPAAVADLNRGVEVFELSTAQIAAGDVCSGAQRLELGLRSLESARLVLQTAIAAPVQRTPGVSDKYGDTTEATMKLVNLKMYKADLDRLGRESATGRGVFDNVCKAGARKRGSQAVITKIDDGNWRIELGSGQTVGIAAGFEDRTDLYPGRIVVVDGIHFGDNSTLAIFVQAVDQPTLSDIGAFFDCMQVRFTPVQRSLPYWNGPFIKHHPRGYDRGPVYNLEHGMGIAAENIGCPPLAFGGYYRYSLRIQIRYRSSVTGLWVNATLASDLDANDRPVLLPAAIDDYSQATIRVISRRQWVVPQIGGPPLIAQLPRVLMEREYVARVHPRNEFCSARYEKTVFTLEDKDMVNFRRAKVDQTVALAVATDPGTSLDFRAEGYTWLPPAASSYPDVETIHKGTPFSVFNFDFVQPGMLHPWETWGTNKASGLAWPQIVGQLNGREFSYSCSLPGILRDAVSECGDGVRSFYRLPFHKVTGPWTVGQGNNGTLSHFGQQAFAFDFSPVLNSPALLAARGGVVRFVDESHWANCPPNGGCPANTLIISHPDGDESVYLHMPQAGVQVSVGQRVYRGDPVAVVGNTGQSTGPHVHFQVQPDQTVSPGAQTVPIVFQSTWPNSVLQRDCHVPVTDEWVVSNNPL